MSEENVEVVRRWTEGWERMEWDGLEELVAPDVEQHGTVGGLEEGRVLRGIEEIRRDYETVEENWDEHRIAVEKLIDAGDRVVVFHREFMRGKNSGVELDIEAAVLMDLRDGRIVRVQGFIDRAAALAVAGVSG